MPSERGEDTREDELVWVRLSGLPQHVQDDLRRRDVRDDAGLVCLSMGELDAIFRWEFERCLKSILKDDYDDAAFAGIVAKFNSGYQHHVYERRPGRWHLWVPFYYPDSDPVDVYLTASPDGRGWVRICEFGLAVMRASFAHDFDDADFKRRMFEAVRSEHGVENDGGMLYIDVPFADLYEGIRRFVACIQRAHSAWGVEGG